MTRWQRIEPYLFAGLGLLSMGLAILWGVLTGPAGVR